MLLVVGMLGLPLASLVKVDDAVPGARIEVSTASVDDTLDLERSIEGRASRSAARSFAPDETTTTEAPTTTEATTTTAPPPPPPTTTAAPPPTTAKPRPATTTTAKPAPTTTTTKPPPPTTTTPPPTSAQEGKASFYDAHDPAVCAHRTLPFGTVLRVTNLDNGKRTTCRVGDRGPYIDGRVVDLSRETFAELAPLSQGVISVRIEW